MPALDQSMARLGAMIPIQGAEPLVLVVLDAPLVEGDELVLPAEAEVALLAEVVPDVDEAAPVVPELELAEDDEAILVDGVPVVVGPQLHAP
jgi:hypothetical protein